MEINDIRNLASIYKTILGNRKADYLSTPITTGLDYYQLLLSEEPSQALKAKCIQDNLERSLHARGRVQRALPPNDLLICPSEFYSPHWSQEEYMVFWKEVIHKYVDFVYMNDGWEYSNGCVEEFFYASGMKIPVYNLNFQPITLEEGKSMIEAAILKLEKMGHQNSPLSKLYKQLSASTHV